MSQRIPEFRVDFECTDNRIRFPIENDAELVDAVTGLNLVRRGGKLGASSALGESPGVQAGSRADSKAAGNETVTHWLSHSHGSPLATSRLE